MPSITIFHRRTETENKRGNGNASVACARSHNSDYPFPDADSFRYLDTVQAPQNNREKRGRPGGGGGPRNAQNADRYPRGPGRGHGFTIGREMGRNFKCPSSRSPLFVIAPFRGSGFSDGPSNFCLKWAFRLGVKPTGGLQAYKKQEKNKGKQGKKGKTRVICKNDWCNMWVGRKTSFHN